MVGNEEAKEFADQHSLRYFETSALSGDRIEDLCIDTAQLLYDKMKEGNIRAGTYYADLEAKVVPVRREHELDVTSGCC
jgi:hypothetical protein